MAYTPLHAIVFRALTPSACLTVQDIAESTDLTPKQVSRQLRRMIEDGLIARAERGCYRLTAAGRKERASGGDGAPRTAERPTPATAIRSGIIQSRTWNALRCIQKGTVADLSALVSADGCDQSQNVRSYLSLLAQAGYVRRLPRKDGRWVRWALTKNTVPSAPMVRQDRRSIYDPNTGQEVPCHG
jgi:DNA-binding transcriptional ArsR family regulator